MLYLSADDIRRVTDMRDMIEAVKQAFAMAEEKEIETPLRTVIPGQENGSFLFMPAYSERLGTAAVKYIGVFPGNAGRGLPTSYAQILLIDGATGAVQALMDGAFVTKLRTGAASGAAFDLLAKKHCRKGALIGTGGQAATQLEAMLYARPLEEVSIFGRNAEKCRAFTEKMSEELSRCGVKLTAAASAEECIDDADLIITVTTATEPVFDGRAVKPGATLSCIGTFEPEKHELDPRLLQRASKVFCDSTEAVLSESGDLLIPLRDGLISADKIAGDLGAVINGRLAGRETEDEIIVFESVGIAAQDLAAAKTIYDKALAAQVGTVLV